jgi:hypothetical protein
MTSNLKYSLTVGEWSSLPQHGSQLHLAERLHVEHQREGAAGEHGVLGLGVTSQFLKLASVLLPKATPSSG